jgi:hypothetical protein
MKAIEFIVGRTESGQPIIHTIWIEVSKHKSKFKFK